jgi:hypothetical protein
MNTGALFQNKVKNESGRDFLPSKRICLAISLVKELMTVDASERIDLKHSMEHPWMKLEVKMTG